MFRLFYKNVKMSQRAADILTLGLIAVTAVVLYVLVSEAG